MKIRPYRPGDMPGLEQMILEAEGFGKEFLDSTKVNITNTTRLDTAETFVAVSGEGEPLGFCDCWVWHTGMEVEDLVVGKSARGQDIGRKLMEHAISWGRKRDAVPL